MQWDKATDEQLLVIFKYDHHVPKHHAIELISELTRRRIMDKFILHHIRKSFDRYSKERKYEYDDLIQWGYYAVSEALQYYKTGKGAISTLCHLSIERRMIKEFWKSSADKRTGETISLNNQQHDENETEFIDRITDNQNVEKTVVNRVLMEGWFSLLDEIEVNILKMFADGYSMNEIARVMGYSGAAFIHRKFHNAMKKINPDYVKCSLKDLGLMTMTKAI